MQVRNGFLGLLANTWIKVFEFSVLPWKGIIYVDDTGIKIHKAWVDKSW